MLVFAAEVRRRLTSVAIPPEREMEIVEEISQHLEDRYARARKADIPADEAVAAYEASGAKRLLLTHRPKELSLDDGLEQAHDGLQLDV